MSIKSFNVTFVSLLLKMESTIIFERDGFILDLCALGTLRRFVEDIYHPKDVEHLKNVEHLKGLESLN